MAKELMEIGGFITSGAEIVNHDASLSGNGTVDSPLGLNETVLWDGNGTPATSVTISESMSNFEMLKFLIINTDNQTSTHTIITGKQASNICFKISTMSDEPKEYVKVAKYDISNNTIALSKVIKYTIANGLYDWNTSGDSIKILKVIGINRKAQ